MEKLKNSKKNSYRRLLSQANGKIIRQPKKLLHRNASFSVYTETRIKRREPFYPSANATNDRKSSNTHRSTERKCYQYPFPVLHQQTDGNGNNAALAPQICLTHLLKGMIAYTFVESLICDKNGMN